MKFVKLHDNRTGISYPWMADIDSINDFLKLEESFCTRNANNIWEYLNSKDFYYDVDRLYSNHNLTLNGNHCHPRNKLVPFLHACVMTMGETKNVIPMLYFSEKLTEASKKKLEFLLKFGRIFVNINGGFFTPTKDIVVTETINSDKFPQYLTQDVKISKWPEGKHFYATTPDGTSVRVDGQKKWNTEQEAINAVKKWLNSY